MDQELLEKVMNQVKAELGSAATPAAPAPAAAPSMKGDANGHQQGPGPDGIRRHIHLGDTIGLVIASVDPMLKDAMKLGKFRSIGIIGGRTGPARRSWLSMMPSKRRIRKSFLLNYRVIPKAVPVTARSSSSVPKTYPMPAGL